MAEETPNPPAKVGIFQKIRESMLGAMDAKSRSIMSDLQDIQNALRPGLTKIAHSVGKPYVEPTIETDFLQRWDETENKDEILRQVSQKYQQMLESVPERSKWRL